MPGCREKRPGIKKQIGKRKIQQKADNEKGWEKY
jgi:hypothetical protein